MARKIKPIGRYIYQYGYDTESEWSPSKVYQDGVILIGYIEKVKENGRNIANKFISRDLVIPFRNIKINLYEKEMAEINQLNLEYKIAIPKPPITIDESTTIKISQDIYNISKVENVNDNELTLFLEKRRGELTNEI